MWSSIPNLSVLALVAIAFLVAGKLVYNVFLHPLRHYPGPKWWAATRLPWLSHSIKGDLHVVLTELHRQYGNQPIRIAPDELSYIQPGAWKQV